MAGLPRLQAGHNLGLSHDGKGSSDPYYYGHNGWAPIMGVGECAAAGNVRLWQPALAVVHY